MKYLRSLDLLRTAVEELPISIRNLTGLELLFINGCKSLVRLPINSIPLLQNLRKLGLGGPMVEDEILSREEKLLELLRPTNSSTALQVLNLPNCPQLESSFFPKSSFFTVFNSLATLNKLILSESEMVSLPTCIKGFVALRELYLRDCEKLEEILELPPNIRSVDATGCMSLQRFSKVSRILKFNGSHIRSLRMIQLGGCEKMHEKIWNYKEPNPLLCKRHYKATALSENEIPEWFWYQKEFLENEIAKSGNDGDFQLRKNEEWVINIEGPHYLEDISGIVVYALVFNKEAHESSDFIYDAEITNNNSNHVHRIDMKWSI
ncbi:disease resistance protein RPS4B-like [Juglans microcarpa x Juglans regia]|uniref:disease resistance protein RPS4B-like n=1 Tax=Juglans microcarpa x Juglans regia TaxID=2249226 RepID=UPI001B7E3B01|nr:disease resistance protein RPS4B-like [Juglans microcarpa x Juglans regia]